MKRSSLTACNSQTVFATVEARCGVGTLYRVFIRELFNEKNCPGLKGSGHTYLKITLELPFFEFLFRPTMQKTR